MNIYILRHGPACDKDKWAPKPDHLRPLTKSGKRKVKEVAKGMRRQGLSFDAILTSPLKRAYQTAKIVAKTLGQKKRLTEASALAPSGAIEDLMIELSHHKKWDDVLLVGHEPALGQLLTLLTTGLDTPLLEMKKAGLAKLHAKKPHFGRCATLEYLLPPKLIS